MRLAELEKTLSKLERRVDGLSTTREQPRNLLRILRSSQSEKSWQLLLSYFLDPDQPHGFETDVLSLFLDAVSEHPETEFSYEGHELEGVAVELETPTGDGRPDIVLWVDEEWFICIELKVTSGETDRQTERYVKADHFGNLKKSTIPEDGHHYVYVADRRSKPSVAPEFADISWQQITQSLEKVQTSQFSQYPARSCAQLAEFIDTTKQELRMTDEASQHLEKAALAIKYRDVFEELDSGLERFVEDLQVSWERDFLNNPPDGWTEEWKTVKEGNMWGRLMKRSWLLNDDPEAVPNKSEGFAIAFPIGIRTENFYNEKTYYKFWVYGDDEYVERYLDQFYSEEFQNTIKSLVEKNNLVVEDRGGKPQPFKTPYSFEFDEGRGYVRALRRAFEEHRELVPHLERLYFDIRETIEQ